ncbi:MAG: nucleotidyltransferase family protein [Anaerolineae bacterium]|nr:nucleotidyltransferase family protein [Anaerolineae bacterium]
MDAIITAGGTLKPTDPLFQLTGVDKKALIPLVGKPMIGWIIEAIQASGIVDNIVIVGLKPQDLAPDYPHLYFTDAAGDIIDNVFAGLDRLQTISPQVKNFLLVSSDIPLITPETIRGFVEECGVHDAEVYYAMVEEKLMESRFPISKRTYIPFKGGRYTGGDIFLMNSSAVRGNITLAKAATGARKNYLQQIRLIGWSFIFRFLLRRLTVHQAAIEVSAKANLDGRVIATKYAELGMDLDKPQHYDIIKAHLETRQTQKVNS